MASSECRKIAVIGTINRDTVVRPDGTRIYGYGGILYNLFVLSRMSESGLEIWPVVNIGEDHDRRIRAVVERLPQITTSAMRTVAARNNHCLLKYESTSDKTEKLSGWVGSVSRRQLSKILDSDYILVNYISGSDITTANLTWLRSQTRAMVYMDFHSRTLGRHADGSRFLRCPKDWRQSVRCADILQMNDLEFRLLTRQSPDHKNCRQFMAKEMDKGARSLLVTLGSRGCIACYRRGTAIVAQQIVPQSTKNPIDTTGCGDVFSAAFLSTLMQGASIPSAALSAVRIATMRAESASVEDIDFTR